VRTTGSLDAVPTTGAADHLCWVHGGDDDPAFDDAVRTFLAGGPARGERLLCVGERAIDSVRDEAAPLPDVDRLVDDGTLGLMTVAEAYAATGDFSAERQFEFYDAATAAPSPRASPACAWSPSSPPWPRTCCGGTNCSAGSTSRTGTWRRARV
jgi:hypothetical protein